MKIKTEYIYICDYCGKKSHSANEIEECELLDTSLTKEEMVEWQKLTDKAKQTTWDKQYYNKPSTQEAEEKTYDNLLNFEKEHNLNEEQIKKNIAKRKLQTIGILDENGEIVRALRDILTNKG